MIATLSSTEQRVVGRMRQLPPAVVQEVDDFVAFLAARHADWTYDDPASLERAVYAMASDPFLQREIRAINDEFAGAENDGLEQLP